MADAKDKMEKFIDLKQQQFVEDKGDQAMFDLWQARHPIMDSTSPAHEGFKEWKGLSHPIEAKKHRDLEKKISPEKLDETVKKVKDFYEESKIKKAEQEKQKD